ncbi:MAG: DUF2961 domain-containing protein [Pirellulaceae bacterium]|nr:DUF2961 domain-containing protein [Pirellulaceae bacterium]
MRRYGPFLLVTVGLWTTCPGVLLAQAMSPVPGGLQSLPFLTKAETRSISAENPTGARGQGGMMIPNPSEPPESQAASARAADDLGQGWKVKPFLRVNAGQVATLMDVAGPGVLQHIWLVEQLSRDHVLRFYWDHEETPSIEVPAPDFFAVGHERFAPVNSLAVIVNPANALNCYWPMPFRRHARVTLTNEGTSDLTLLAYQITYQLTDIPENTAYLHAQWRRANTGTQNPYVVVDGIRGNGRYVGTFLAWTQMERGWWGEGEIKFFLDGDLEFPTICGTGTEDYFCGSYGFAQPYSTAYVGTTLPTKDNDPPPSQWSLYRWHIPDPICFQQELRVTIQALGWYPHGKYKKTEDDIASVAYWYQSEPHAAFPPLPPIEARRPIHTMLQVKGGGIEGESLQVQAVTRGEAKIQDVRFVGARWSQDKHLWWTGAGVGDTLTLGFDVPETATYHLFARLTKARDYGIVQLALDGQPAGEPLDLYHPAPMPTGEVELDARALEAGRHELTVKIVGANELAEKAYMFGIDYLRLERAKAAK